MPGRVLLDGQGVTAAIASMTDTIVGLMSGASSGARRPARWALVGVRRGGVEIADRLRSSLVARGLPAPERGDIDITLYRDDLYTGLERPVLGDTELPFEVTDAGVILVDDVLFTGRTVRAALGEIHDFGRPAFVRLAVLVDRGHRELPVCADIVGCAVTTQLRDRVRVELRRGGPGPDDRVVVDEVGA